jgi:glutathione S-transferase
VNDLVELYAIPGSHPVAAVERALQMKGIPYERVDLLPGLAPLVQKATFGRRTVPGLRIGKHSRVVGSRLIMRTLDSLVPEPPLFPHDPEARALVEEAEEWGDTVLQDEVRPIILTGIAAKPSSVPSFLEGARIPLPPALAAVTAPPMFRAEIRLLGFPPARVRELIECLPSRLDHVDTLIAEEVIGDPESPNAADLQIGSSIALLARFDDVLPLLEGRPCKALADRLFPDFPGHVPSGALDIPVPAPAGRQPTAA